ncbi:Fanconi anemia group M protein isoform X2 [Boleophthalmus pectinirostris]|nr:Fanconi anemia group M protein isoform X2 [Boleophthalmus pectinirostris]
MSRLVQNRVMGHKDLRTLSKYQLILARDQFRKNPPPNIKGPQQGMLEGDFALCISLYHGYELLMQMGLRSLFFYVQGIMDGSREMSRARNELQRTPTFMDLYQEMEVMFMKSLAGPEEPFVYSHPKLQKLEEVVLQHFKQWPTGLAETVSTRVMIFSSFRESVQEIASMLNCHGPLIRVMTFMGQASAGKGVKGFTQKEQLEVVQRFRQGGFNTLVSTCVGEEGLDIGEVDLIVCFDAQKNPIRLVQRMGRTGRKRQGRIVVILAEGREEKTYNQSQSNKRSIYKSITSNHNGFSMYPHSPRMLPDGVNPILHKMHIMCGQFEPRESSRRSKGRRSTADGRTSLIHPYSLIQQATSVSNGFLNSTEYSVWASTMKLDEDEAHPILKPSRFLSFPTDLHNQEQECTSVTPSRELSLSEWRHWQNKSLPTHAVEHSLRCQHFIKIMELIDQMKYEPEGQCHYEDDLRPYLSEANSKNAQKKSKPCVKPKKTSHSFSYDPDFITEEPELNLPEEEQRFLVESVAAVKTTSPIPVNNNCIDLLEDDCILNADPEHIKSSLTDHNPDHIPLMFNEDEDLELQAMFYLPNWGCRLSSIKPVGKDRDDNLKVILANVSELLSRPPPSLDFEDILCSVSEFVSPKELPCQPFQVSFTLDDEDEEEEMEINDNTNCMEDLGAKTPSDKGNTVQNSPTWEEVFEDDVYEEDANIETKEKVLKCTENTTFKPDINESMDLFEDDEAFLQMSIPDVPTPEDSPIHQKEQENCEINKSEILENVANTTKRMALGNTHIDNSLIVKNDTRLANESITVEEPICTRNVQPESLENSNDLFSVNFDLGFSMDDSEEEEITEAKCIPPSPQPKTPRLSVQVSSSSSTPCTGFSKQEGSSVRSREARLSTPRLAHLNKSGRFPSSPLGATGSALPSPISSLHTSAPRRKLNQTKGAESGRNPVKSSTDSEEEVVIQNRKQPKKVNYFSSPEKTRNVSDVDSPFILKRKRVAALDTSSEVEKGAISDDDFQNDTVFTNINPGPGPKRKHLKQGKDQRSSCRRVHQFLDNEAELSEDEDGVSSDEEDGEEQNRSLEGFVVDNSHLSQGLNESEMHGVYLKSVRSPAMLGKFKMSYKNRHNMDIFSQVPEMDETYAEDSFVVGSDEEEQSEDYSEEEEEGVGPLLPEESYVDGRRQYATRRRVFLHQARAKGKTHVPPANRGGTKAKLARVIRIQDSSDEETEGNDTNAVVKTDDRSNSAHGNRLEHQNGQSSSSSIAFKMSRQSQVQKALPTNEQRDERYRKRIETEHLLSDELDFVESESLLSNNVSAQSAPSASALAPPQTCAVDQVRLLVDSRCLTGAVELVTWLRQRHSAVVHVCSLDSSYIIVSARMAVERHSQSEFASVQNRKRLVERVNRLQTLFERVCLIVEKDRIKPGDTTRPFQRTRYYDSTLVALVRSGLRLLWSNGPEDSAALLVELARLEQRKSHGISVPLEVTGAHRQQALQMYLNLPSVNYVHALNLCHNFRTVGQLINSSIEAIQKGGCMSRSRAEEVYRFLRYSCDSFLMNTSR